jgi:surfeit locus 1 family protein
MIARLRERKLLIPTVMVILALPMLLSLGFWQLDRREWKEGLLADIANRTRAEPVALERLLKGVADAPVARADLEYARARVRGQFLHDRELYLYAPSQTYGPGYHVYTPFQIAGSGDVLIVNRGYVPERFKAPAGRAQGQVDGDVDVVGLVRLPGAHARFVPDNDPKGNLWFWRDFDGMLAATFPKDPPKSLPLFIEAEADAPGGWPKGGVTELKLPNRHLEYALTWFGLALVLAAIYAMYAIPRLRGR